MTCSKKTSENVMFVLTRRTRWMFILMSHFIRKVLFFGVCNAAHAQWTSVPLYLPRWVDQLTLIALFRLDGFSSLLVECYIDVLTTACSGNKTRSVCLERLTMLSIVPLRHPAVNVHTASIQLRHATRLRFHPECRIL